MRPEKDLEVTLEYTCPVKSRGKARMTPTDTCSAKQATEPGHGFQTISMPRS